VGYLSCTCTQVNSISEQLQRLATSGGLSSQRDSIGKGAHQETGEEEEASGRGGGAGGDVRGVEVKSVDGYQVGLRLCSGCADDLPKACLGCIPCGMHAWMDRYQVGVSPGCAGVASAAGSDGMVTIRLRGGCKRAGLAVQLMCQEACLGLGAWLGPACIHGSVLSEAFHGGH
jgi:hypothetical protein